MLFLVSADPDSRLQKSSLAAMKLRGWSKVSEDQRNSAGNATLRDFRSLMAAQTYWIYSVLTALVRTQIDSITSHLYAESGRACKWLRVNIKSLRQCQNTFILRAMPASHERTFRVRYYECDFFGHLNNVNYVRYMQEAAFDASAAIGYDVLRYIEVKHHWLIYDTDIEYLRPARYGDSIRVKTWIADARRVRARRAYELREVASNEMLARAYSDWVYLRNDNGRPASIPEDLLTAFMPDGPDATASARTRFPGAPPAPASAFKLQRRTGWRDVDPAQHVNNATYLGYAEDCRIEASAAHGWPMTRLTDAGLAIVTRRHRIEYQQPALLGDDLELTMWFSNARRATVDLHYNIIRVSDSTPIARIYTLLVCVDLQNGKPLRFPKELMKDFAPMVVA